MVNKIGYGCCVGSWDKFHKYVEPRIYPERPILTAYNQISISVAYNAILDGFKVYDLDAVILIHDDLEMIDPNTEEKVLRAFDELGDPLVDDVALVGVAGGGRTLGWWDVDPIGHQLIDTGLLDFGGVREGFVDMIEGSFMAFSRWAIQELRFDERYEFHGYDDVCLEAARAGKRVIVTDIDTHHHTTLGYKTESSIAMRKRAEKIFNSKWSEKASEAN